uniref:Peptidase S8/S53 domain-containing protein n=1 Tax=Setaria italica TaxID=4555 RepID=A0A341LI10_SETIT
PKTAYIVHTDHLTKPFHFATLGHWYTSMVSSLSTAANSSRVFYVYDTTMHGFAAELTDDEARRLSNTTGVASVHKDRLVHLHTTRSAGFLGLDKDFGIWPDTDFGNGVIIGFVDSGIWPESASFDDTGLGPVRPSWKGRCVDGERFNSSMCNNKLVGARFFTAGPSVTRDDDFMSPRDKAGHGTHVASTAAGSEVPDAGLFGFARGVARGVAPRARVAMYKACVLHSCSSAGVVEAIDDAGVYIFVTCSAGNFGPREYTLSNVAPWITTVGAATVDRVFPVSITLGDGQVLTGQSLYAHATNRTEMIPLLPSNCSNDLVSDRITGKIVMCARDFGVYPSYGVAVKMAGGSGLISVAPLDRCMEGLMVQAFTLPAVTVSSREADRLAVYIDSVPDPVASFCFTSSPSV